MAYEDLFSGVQGTGAQSAYNPFSGIQGLSGVAAGMPNQSIAALLGNSAPQNIPQQNDFQAQPQSTGAATAFSFDRGQYTPTQSGGGVSSSPFVTGGSGGGDYSSQSSSGYTPNPYLREQMSALTGQYQQNFLQNTAPQLRASALASGQYGGSRQGIAEGVAQGNAATGLASALANLQAGTYQTDTSNALQGQSLANQYNLGMGQLGLGYGNLGLGYSNLQNNANIANQNFYTSQRGQDLQQYGLGASLANQGLTGQTSVGQGQYNLGNVYQQAPMQALNTYSNALQPYTGYGQSNTTTSNTGGGFSGAAGGALAGMNIGNRIGNYMGGSGGWDPYSGSTGATNSNLMSLFGNGMG